LDRIFTNRVVHIYIYDFNLPDAVLFAAFCPDISTTSLICNACRRMSCPGKVNSERTETGIDGPGVRGNGEQAGTATAVGELEVAEELEVAAELKVADELGVAEELPVKTDAGEVEILGNSPGETTGLDESCTVTGGELGLSFGILNWLLGLLSPSR
jgi:hypothetical protein